MPKMIPVNIYLIWMSSGLHAKFFMSLHAVPRVNEYVQCPGCGSLGLKVHSVIHSSSGVTVQVREDDTPKPADLQEMRRHGWKISS